MEKSAKPGAFAKDMGCSSKGYKEPGYQSTKPEAKGAKGAPSTPMKKMEVTKPGPYSRNG